MQTQLKIVTKDEAHKYIDENPEKEFLIITFNKRKGISDNGKFVNKKKCIKMTDEAETIVLSGLSPFVKLDLHDTFFANFTDFDEGNIVKSIMLAANRRKEIQYE